MMDLHPRQWDPDDEIPHAWNLETANPVLLDYNLKEKIDTHVSPLMCSIE